MGKYSHQRLESTILELLNEVLKFHIQNPIISRVSFTYVKLTKDKSIAHVFVDKLDHENIDLSINELNKASGIFRNYLSKELVLKKTPKIIFFEDNAINRSMKIEKILKEIKEDNK